MIPDPAEDVSHVTFPLDPAGATLVVPLTGGRIVEIATFGCELRETAR